MSDVDTIKQIRQEVENGISKTSTDKVKELLKITSGILSNQSMREFSEKLSDILQFDIVASKADIKEKILSKIQELEPINKKNLSFGITGGLLEVLLKDNLVVGTNHEEIWNFFNRFNSTAPTYLSHTPLPETIPSSNIFGQMKWTEILPHVDYLPADFFEELMVDLITEDSMPLPDDIIKEIVKAEQNSIFVDTLIRQLQTDIPRTKDLKVIAEHFVIRPKMLMKLCRFTRDYVRRTSPYDPGTRLASFRIALPVLSKGYIIKWPDVFDIKEDEYTTELDSGNIITLDNLNFYKNQDIDDLKAPEFSSINQKNIHADHVILREIGLNKLTIVNASILIEQKDKSSSLLDDMTEFLNNLFEASYIAKIDNQTDWVNKPLLVLVDQRYNAEIESRQQVYNRAQRLIQQGFMDQRLRNNELMDYFPRLLPLLRNTMYECEKLRDDIETYQMNDEQLEHEIIEYLLHQHDPQELEEIRGYITDQRYQQQGYNRRNKTAIQEEYRKKIGEKFLDQIVEMHPNLYRMKEIKWRGRPKKFWGRLDPTHEEEFEGY